VPRGSVCVKQCRAKLRGVKHNQDNHTGTTTDLDPCLAVVTTTLSHFASRTVLAVHCQGSVGFRLPAASNGLESIRKFDIDSHPANASAKASSRRPGVPLIVGVIMDVVVWLRSRGLERYGFPRQLDHRHGPAAADGRKPLAEVST
jgi:hypothetical protein